MDAFQRNALAALLFAGLGQSVMAADAWECRVSADGSSWDCYRDGTLVMQPMPQTQSVPPAVVEPATDPVTDENAEPVSPTASEPQPETAAAVVSVPKPEPEIQPEPQQEAQTEKGTAPKPEQVPETIASPAEVPPPEAEEISEEVPEPVTEPLADSTKDPEQLAVPEPQPEPAPEPDPEQGPEPETAAGAKPVSDEIAETADTTVAETTAMQAAALKPRRLPDTSDTSAERPATLYCSNRPRKITRQPPTGAPMLVEADDAVIDDNTSLATFSGNVVLIDEDQKIESDSLRYNTETEDVDAEGNLLYQRPDLAFTGSSAHMNLGTETGTVNQAVYQLPASNARGSTGTLEMQGEGITVYRDATYTTCAQGNDDWIFEAEEIELDENTGVGTAKNMKLFFMDAPIVYLPWATFPIDDRRKSGFLTPSIGSSDANGFDVSTPYYLNLAPNYDATLRPRYMSERGLMLGGEFRYLDQSNRLTVNGDVLPSDDKYVDNKTRGALSLNHSASLNQRLSTSININAVSDDDYLIDLGDNLATTSTSHLERSAAFNYSGGWFNLAGQFLQYQTIDKSIASVDYPYKLLPRINFVSKKDLNENLTLDFNAEFTSFDHSLKVDGNRLDLKPTLTQSWNRSWGFLKPRASLRHTRYDLDNRAPGLENSINRTTTTFSLDSGLFFDRPTSWFGDQATQTLEPRAFYVYTPYEKQDNIPLFDTSDYGFDSGSLFREERFSGPDRVGDTNQLTLAVTSRFVSDKTAREYLAVTLGQIFYFEDREIGSVSYYEDSTTQTSVTSTATNDASSYVLTLTSQPFEFWSFDAGLQWDANITNDMEKSYARVRYLDDKRHLFTARYQYDGVNNEYTRISAYWPVGQNTRLVGHSYYSIDQDRAIESVLGVEHGSSCCWKFRVLARDYQAGASQDNNLTFFMQLELSGFTSFGDDIDSYLEETIEGFVREQ